MKILRAAEVDLREILDLQYRAYRSEAVLLNKFDIPPLKQNLADLQAEYREKFLRKGQSK